MALIIFVFASAAFFPAAALADVGVNLAELSGGSQNTWPYTDLFQHSTQFSARTRTFPWDNGNRVLYSRQGLPVAVNFTAGGTAASGAHAFVGSVTPTINYSPSQTIPSYLPGTYVLLWGASSVYLYGDYTVYFVARTCIHTHTLARTQSSAEGNVTIELDGDVRLLVNSSSPGFDASCVCGRVVVALSTPSLGIVVRIFRLLDPAHPLRALHLVPIELESKFNSTDLFHPRFVGLIRAIRDTAAVGAAGDRGPLMLRFAGWAQELATITFAPYAATATWEGRAVPGSWGITPAGVPLEHMCALVRATGAGSAWFSVPQNAAGAASVAGEPSRVVAF
jgi:hypothetical protein